MKRGFVIALTIASVSAACSSSTDVSTSGAGPFSFASRKTSIVTVDSVGVITSVGPGSIYVVATLVSGTHMLMDSVAVLVGVPIGNKAPATSE